MPFYGRYGFSLRKCQNLRNTPRETEVATPFFLSWWGARGMSGWMFTLIRVSGRYALSSIGPLLLTPYAFIEFCIDPNLQLLRISNFTMMGNMVQSYLRDNR